MAWLSSWITCGLGSISAIHSTPSRCPRSSSTRRATSRRARACRARRRTGRAAPRGRSERAASSRCSHALLPGDAADEDDGRAVGIDAEALQHVRAAVRRVLVAVDAVVDDPDALRVDRRIAGQDVLAHALGHGDDGVGVLDGHPLAELRHLVAAAELLGLPGPQRLEAVGARDVRDAVHQLREVPGEVRVPGVGVDDVGALGPGRHREVDGHRAQRRQVRRRAGEGVPGRVVDDGRRRVRRDLDRAAEEAHLWTVTSSSAASSRARYSTWTPAPP